MSTTLPELARRLPVSVLLFASSPALAAPDADQAAPAIDSRDADPLDALVVVRATMEGGGEIAELLRTEIIAALREARVDPALPGPLEVEVSPDLEEVGAYEVVYRHRGEIRDSWSCLCSGEELRARLARDAIVVWNGIVTSSSREAPDAASPAPTEPEHVDTEPASRQRRRGQGLWVAGVTTAAIGTAVTVGTAALLLSDVTTGHDRSPATLGLLGGGVAMVATGVTLWIIGARPRNRAQLSVFPTIRSRGALVMLGGKF